jgi:predicted secreted Zn-dependent protease
MTVNVILFENRVFVQDQIKMRSLGYALMQCDYVLTKEGNLGTERDRHMGDCVCVVMKAGIWVMYLQPRNANILPEARRKAWNRLPITVLKKELMLPTCLS